MIALLAVGATLAAGGEPEVEESWAGLDPPVVGQGEPELTVLIRGASEQRPLQARLGEVQGDIERLGLAVFGLTLAGVPEEGQLVVEDRRGRRTWQGRVRTEGAAVVGFSWVGGPTGRPERLPVPAALPGAAACNAGLASPAWLMLCLGAGLALLRRSSR